MILPLKFVLVSIMVQLIYVLSIIIISDTFYPSNQFHLTSHNKRGVILCLVLSNYLVFRSKEAFR